MSSKFWTICLLVLILIGSCLVMSGCGKAKKDEPETTTSSYTTWDNGSITYWENVETENVEIENVEIEIKEIEVKEITIE